MINVRAPCALSYRTRLSASLPVASSPLVPQTAMSPTASSTGAPWRAISRCAAPSGVGDASLPLHATSASIVALAIMVRFIGAAPYRDTQCVSLECEAEVRIQPASTAIREHDLNAGRRIPIPDPDTTARRGMPP